MNEEEVMDFGEVIKTIGSRSPNAWVYLPSNKNWSLDTKSAILESDEVPPELEDEPDAGVPEIAKRNGLIQVLPVTVLQDIITNARSQKEDATLQEIFEAFEFYYNNDAFIILG
jgi:hypothetical protein